MANTNLLIIDDELGFYSGFRRKHQARYAFEVSSDADQGLAKIKPYAWDAVLLDLEFKGQYAYDDGLFKLLPRAVELAQDTIPILVATFDNRKDTVQRAEQNGAARLLRKGDYDSDAWDKEIQKTIQDFKSATQAKKKAAEQQKDNVTVHFIALTEDMVDLKNRLRKRAEYPGFSVLLEGEPGVGKEVAAKFIHYSKSNKKIPFVAVNLSALGEKIVESEIFGHVKGAFTDATSDKAGYFEKAKGGTLFLDEIGEVSLEIQVKLLRVLETKEFSRVGSTTPIQLESQLIFATNRDLERAVAEGHFREDFYGRIKSHTVHIPPLRERVAEIEPLIAHFWETELQRKASHPMYGKKIEACFAKETLQKMRDYTWPGNIRELKSTVEELIFEVDFQGKKSIDPSLLPVRFHFFSPDNTPGKFRQPPTILTEPIEQFSSLPSPPAYWPIAKQTAYHELAQIEKALIAAGGRREDAALALGLKDDQAIRYKVKVKYHAIFPELFDNFSILKKLYKL
ncbi:MAG: sigma-54-dependent Fis family transcriptional regulator [Saprospiraceae bacterium]|nr:sigma-54-dependent Fis family transcriptional regulator [Saprospiraceae bacterium]